MSACDLMECSTPGFPVLHHLPEFAQTHVHWVGDAIQLSHPLSSPSPPALNLSQHQGLFQWVGSLHQVAKHLGLSQFQHQSFQWIFRVDFFRTEWFYLLAVHWVVHFFFLIFSYMSYLYVLEINPLSVPSFYKYFSHFEVVFSSCLWFTLLCKSF